MNTANQINVDDVKARVDLLAVVEHELGPGRKSGAWVQFFCPFHDNHHTPALAVNVKTQTWKCFGCGKGGDVLAWTMLREGVGFRDALLKYAGVVDLSGPPVHPPAQVSPPELPPSGNWQYRGREFISHCTRLLFSDAGQPGMAELARRGLALETVAHWRLGWYPERRKVAGMCWGFEDAEPVNLFRGLVIPSLVGPELWRIKVRLFEGDVPRKTKPKYLNVRGSQKALFGAEHLEGKPALILCEGELDAMLAWQEAHWFADVLTLGGAGMRLTGRWLPYLLPYRRIVVVYDPDAAGERGAELLKALGERVEVHRPPGGDLCEMHQRGEDVQGWLVNILL